MNKHRHKTVISDWSTGQLILIEFISESYEIALQLSQDYFGFVKIYNERGEIIYSRHHERQHHPHVHKHDEDDSYA